MLFKSQAIILFLSYSVFCDATKIYYKPFGLNNKDINTQPHVLLEYNFIPESSSFMVSNKDTSFEDGKYCLSLDSNAEDCFQIVSLKHDYDYDLEINPKSNRKVSLKTKPTNSGSFKIVPVVSSSLRMPKTPLDLLKKTTKKYEDLQKNKKPSSSNVKNNIAKPVHAELENIENDEEEASFLVKNWRYILLGLLIFKVITSSKEKTTQKKQE